MQNALKIGNTHTGTVNNLYEKFEELNSLIQSVCEDSEWVKEQLDEVWEALLDDAEALDEKENSKEVLLEREADRRYHSLKGD